MIILGNNYNRISPNLKKSLKDLLLSFSTITEELSLKKRKDEGLKEAINAIKVSVFVNYYCVCLLPLIYAIKIPFYFDNSLFIQLRKNTKSSANCPENYS